MVFLGGYQGTLQMARTWYSWKGVFLTLSGGLGNPAKIPVMAGRLGPEEVEAL